MEMKSEDKLLHEEYTLGDKRNYGIDLLKVVSMFLIVLFHVLLKGGVKTLQIFTIKGEVFSWLRTFCSCAVNCYALISGFVGINSKPKGERLISLCIQVMFYAFLITGIEIVIAISSGTEISMETIVLHLFPSISNYWYFSAYFCLFFFMPLLNYVVHNAPRKILKRLFIAILFIFCGWNLLRSNVSGLIYGYSFLWLAILYVIGAYLSKYQVFLNMSVRKSFLGYFICMLITYCARFFIYFLSKAFLGQSYVIEILYEYNSPTMLFAAIFLLNAFSKIKINQRLKKIVSFVAPLTFGVYLIHCHPYVFNFIDDIYIWVINQQVLSEVFCVIVIALIIFLLCLIIDWIRTLIFRVLKIKKLAGWIEKIVGVGAVYVGKLLHMNLADEE